MGKATGYLRYPTISGDTIVFACDDDLWCVGAEGGRAWRLTAGIADASRPRLSPDGTRVAFTGTSEGPTEVYVLPVEGGDARRLTFHGARCATAGWLDDDTIVYASNAGLPFGGDLRLHRISANGGASADLNVGFAGAFSYSAAGPGGPMVLARHTGREPNQWKRYRGGTAGQLWIDTAGDSTFQPLLRDLRSNLAAPCWVGDRVYFLSDHEGIGNVYSVRPDGSDLRRHTDHTDYYARNLATDGTRLVYHSAADLYLLDPANDTTERLDVRIAAGGSQRARRFVDAGEYLDSARLSHDGARIAITTRGKAFSLGAWDGPVVQHGEPEGTRYRMLSWLPSGQELVAAAADIEPDEGLVVLSADGSVPPRALEGLDLGGINSFAVSPVEARIAVSNHRNELVLVDLTGDAPAATIRDSSRFGPIADMVFSPDGRWLAYRFPEAMADPDSDQHSSIKLTHVETGRTARAAERVLHDCSPVFDPDGKYLYFIGYREFNPLYDALHFDLSFPRGARPYAIALRPDVPSPFLSEPRPPGDDNDGKSDKDTKDDGAVTPVEIELDGITRRVVQFPVAEARYTRILAMRGKVALLSTPTDGSVWWGDQLENSQGVLESYDLATKQAEKLSDKVTDVQLSADATTLLYRTTDHRLRVLKAGEKAPEGDEPGRKSGWVDLGRAKVSVRPAYEWPQMFREAWAAAWHYHWSETMSGVDWQRVYDRYAPLVARISTRGELSDLLWEMQGELGTSHAYESGGDYGSRPDYQQGHLGVDYSVDAETGAWRIARIVQGDPADPTASSPLERPGVNAMAGDEIVAINGLSVGPEASPAERLVNLAGQELNLTIRDSSGTTRTVRVEAIGDERRARYREWVEANRRRVHEATAGRLGYLHIPDMLPPGYSEFLRSYLAEYDRDGLLVDVRFNGGGHVSGLVLEKLARRRLGQDYLRWNVSQPYPAESPRGPMVALTNANAGSDGDIVCQGFKMLGLGPLLGERTWGGVVGYTRTQQLADNSMTTQPMLAFSFDDVSWGVENHGVEPDIEVLCAPQDYAAGRDPQLEKAIEVGLEELEKRPPHSHRPAERPHLGLPTLPPRS